MPLESLKVLYHKRIVVASIYDPICGQIKTSNTPSALSHYVSSSHFSFYILSSFFLLTNALKGGGGKIKQERKEHLSHSRKAEGENKVFGLVRSHIGT